MTTSKRSAGTFSSQSGMPPQSTMPIDELHQLFFEGVAQQFLWIVREYNPDTELTGEAAASLSVTAANRLNF